ncbi:MAG TPA: DUF512 domain-containing protein [Bacillota bacterium]|nr:DUF512 domain-containing protein [Bacillota bacterium]
MQQQKGGVIHWVDPDGIGAKVGLTSGDRILSINGEKLNDLIDYSWLITDERLKLLVENAHGKQRTVHIRKDDYEGLGIDFEDPVFDRITPCANRCVFCFVDQMPKGQRPSLYIKDDDYRLSFLQGSYITLTNLRPTDWERMGRLKLSPLYVSVHATDPSVREFLLGTPKARTIMEDLKRLGEMGIQCHTQAVLCPGVNDGAILEKTIQELSSLWPTVASLAVVPVGLTNHRDGLPNLRKFHPEEARSVIRLIETYQQQCLADFDTRWVWPADEFYLQAEMAIPPYETYEDFEQLENGVGLWRLMNDEVNEAIQDSIEKIKPLSIKVGVITGHDAAGLWRTIGETLHQLAPRLECAVYPVDNHFFGDKVTVSGLIVGQDILNMLKHERPAMDMKLLIPQSMLRHGETVFLDGMSLTELRNISGYSIEAVEVSGEAFIETICSQERM